MVKIFRVLNIILIILFLYQFSQARAQDSVNQPEELKIIETDHSAQEVTPQGAQALSLAESFPASKYEDPLKYTLGPDDVIQIEVLKHQEFSGIFPVNLEGKIQYKFVGDIDVTRLTKKQLEQKIKEIISAYIINPEVAVTVLEYRSKVIYVLGEVGQPGKYYMRSESIPLREAVVYAGLPLQSAAMRKTQIITPDKNGKVKTQRVDLYSLLYGGNLKLNYELHAGDILYVPCTVMAKVIRVINPVTAAVNGAASGPQGASTGRTAVTSLTK